MKTETYEEYLARGGKVKKLATRPPKPEPRYREGKLQAFTNLRFRNVGKKKLDIPPNV